MNTYDVTATCTVHRIQKGRHRSMNLDANINFFLCKHICLAYFWIRLEMKWKEIRGGKWICNIWCESLWLTCWIWTSSLLSNCDWPSGTQKRRLFTVCPNKCQRYFLFSLNGIIFRNVKITSCRIRKEAERTSSIFITFDSKRMLHSNCLRP